MRRREVITLLGGAAGNEGAAMRCMLPVTLSLTLILLTSWALYRVPLIRTRVPISANRWT